MASITLGSKIVYMLHITLLILSKGCASRPAFGCSPYMDILSRYCTGARFSFTTFWVNGQGVNHNVYYSIGVF